MVERVKKIFEKIKNNKKIQLVLIIFIALVFCFFLFYDGKSKSIYNISTYNEIDQYVFSLEKRLSSNLSKVEGVRKVSCVITIESGMETVLAMKTTTTNTSSGTEIIETPIIVNGKTVVLKENYPKIKGVLIVAQGAKNITVLTKIQQATISLLDVSTDKIEILAMK